MSFYELDNPHTAGARNTAALANPLTRIGQWFGNGVRAMQYARMVQAMSDLSDEQLQTLAITRADIPRRARAAIYDIPA